jgi:hypothetical protein
MRVVTARRALAGIIALWGMVLVLIVLSACTPLVKAPTVTESIAVVEVQAQAVVKTCATLTNERRITVPQAERCRAAAGQAFAAIDLARSATKTGDAGAASAQLAAARAILIEIEAMTKVPR